MTTILVIDDSEADRFLAKRCIRKFDKSINVIMAGDGQEGLELLVEDNQKVDLILLDINMPRMDGHEFLEAHKKHFGDDLGPPVVVMLTSSDQEQDKQRSMNFSKVRKYVEKALEKKDLEEIFQDESLGLAQAS